MPDLSLESQNEDLEEQGSGREHWIDVHRMRLTGLLFLCFAATGIVLGGLLALPFEHWNQGHLPLIWLSTLVIINVLAVATFALLRDPQKAAEHSVACHYAIGTMAVLAGVAWGAAPFIFDPALPAADTSMYTIVLVAVLAIGVLVLSPLPVAMWAFLGPFLAGLGAKLLLSGAVLPNSLLLAVFVAGGATIATAYLMQHRLDALLDSAAKGRQLAKQAVRLKKRLTSELALRQQIEADLQNALRNAESANVAKSEFLATMSHEIRTPLNGVLPLLDILRDTNLDREQRELVHTAYSSSQHLLKIIDDVLDYSKIESGRLELEIIEMNLKELVEELVMLMSPSAKRKGVKITYHISPDVRPLVRGDPIRIRQIVTNLIGNSIKFTERGYISINISKRHETRESVDLLFTVKDTGVGMSEQTARRLFKPFSQADASTTRTHGGTGLGLVICKRLVDLMKGQIGVRSEPGKGSVFWFLAPLQKSLSDIPAARTELTGSRLLFVGVDSDHYHEFAEHLKEWGLIHDRAESKEEALQKLKSSASLGASWAFEGVLIDMKTCRHLAVGLASDIRSDDQLEGVKVVLFGRASDLSDEIQEFGVRNVLDSSLTTQQLRLMLESVLGVEEPGESDAGNLIDKRPILMSAPAREHAVMEAEDFNRPSEPEELEFEDTVESQDDASFNLPGRVLLVEDNPVNLRVAQRLLKLIGVRYSTATNGKEALDTLERQHCDAVLLDCQMPDMDGYDVTRAIRFWELAEKRPRLPIIAMTAHAMAGDREKCLAVGMDDYLAKPLKKDVLEDKLRKWLTGADDPETDSTVAAIHPAQERGSV
ncbi:MAG: response regulator [Gammaproteobacteria bacterium]|nr:MAG: response regulator [Gammaproteobacteria bacterium]